MQTQMEPRRLRENIERTFAHRATHPIPEELAAPPESWRGRFAELAAQCGIDVDIDATLRSVNEYMRTV
jgi:formate hydrogenlyase subunit 6/NADH:ubiquinone oxidoreductase subunit I